jgi:predicted nucleic acid-binding protein
MFVDTHIISYVRRGLIHQSIRGANISSVVASELLLVYGSRRTAANYYVPLASSLRKKAVFIPRKLDHSPSKRSTDQIVFSFGSDYEPLIEFGAIAVARIVNDRNFDLLRLSASFQSKQRQKIIRENFRFLVESEIRCVPLGPGTVEIGYRLLANFRSSGERVKTTFRNTWNDLLILAAACDHKDTLWSKDSQLNRLAASLGDCREMTAGFLEIRFPQPADARSSPNRESKGYVNKGWRASFRTGTDQAW